MDTLSYVGWPVSGGNPGLKYFRTIGLNAVINSIKATEGSIYQCTFRHPNTSPVFINFYDQPAANVTVGTTVPVMRIMVPAQSGSTPGQLIITPGVFPLRYFAAGISIAAITTDSDTGSTSPASHVYAELQYV